jgi:hypothetical protein
MPATRAHRSGCKNIRRPRRRRRGEGPAEGSTLVLLCEIQNVRSSAGGDEARPRPREGSVKCGTGSASAPGVAAGGAARFEPSSWQLRTGPCGALEAWEPEQAAGLVVTLPRACRRFVSYRNRALNQRDPPPPRGHKYSPRTCRARRFKELATEILCFSSSSVRAPGRCNHTRHNTHAPNASSSLDLSSYRR